MMNSREIEKELGIVEGKIRDLRNKNSDLQALNGKLFNEKIGIQKEINSLVAHKKGLTEEVSGLKEKIEKAEDGFKKDRLSIARDRAAIDQTKAQQQEDWECVADAKNDVTKKEARLREERKGLNDRDKAFHDEERKHKDFLISIKKEKDSVEDLEKTYRKHLQELKNKETSLKQKDGDVAFRMGQADTTRTQAEAEKNEAITKQKHLDGVITEEAKALAQIGKKEEELQKKLLGIQDREAVVAREKASLSSKAKDLKQKEDEFEIKCLRLEKAVREDDVKKELARLRKEIA